MDIPVDSNQVQMLLNTLKNKVEVLNQTIQALITQNIDLRTDIVTITQINGTLQQQIAAGTAPVPPVAPEVQLDSA